MTGDAFVRVRTEGSAVATPETNGAWRTVTSVEAALDSLPGAAGVVCEGPDALSAARTVRRQDDDLPLVVCTGVTDGEAAIAASELGAAYVSREHLEERGETLPAWVERTVAAPVETPADELQEFLRVVSDQSAGFEERIDRLLALGCSYLGLDVGFLSVIDGEDFEIVDARGDHELIRPGASSSLSRTYCRRAIESEGLLGVQDATEEGWVGDPAYERFDLGCYLGGKVLVDGELYGTLCFADDAARDVSFGETERTFVELLVEWVGAELDRRERERKLGELLEWTHELMRTDTAAAVAETVVDAAVDVLGFEYTTVRLYDEETGTLSPVACSDGVREDFGEPPTRSVGEPGAGVAFERGAPVDYDPADEEGIESGPDADYGPLKASYILPLGGHGTFGIGSPVPDAFGGTDRQLAELLATTATAALDRVDRRQELARYGAVFETIRDMVFVLDGDGRATMVSEPLADRIGLDRGTLQGRHVSEFVAEGTVESALDHVREMRDGDRRSVTVETVVESVDGEQFPGVAELSLLPGEEFRGVVGVLRDVTDLRETEAELATERDRFRRLFENLPDPADEVEFVDGEPRIRALNDAFADAFGVDPETVVGQSANEVIVPAGEDGQSTAIDERVRAGETVTAELQRETADGPRDFLFRGVPFETDRAFGIYTDVTDQRRRERHLQVLNRVLRHNLRNDLNVVLALTDLITDRSTDPEVVDLASQAHEQADRLVSLSRQAVDIEQTLHEEVNLGAVDLEALVTSVAVDAREEHPDATVEVDVPSGTTVIATDRFRAALANLVENAIVHHDGEPWVGVETEPGGDTVSVRVIDDGPGIPEHERTVVTGESEITQLNHGSGLGLWLAKWVVEASGGDIAFHERDGGGSVVELTLRPADG